VDEPDDYASVVRSSKAPANDNNDVPSSNYNEPVLYTEVSAAQNRDLADLYVNASR